MADGDITSDEYMMKLDRFVSSRTEGVKGLNNQYQLRACYDRVAPFYKNEKQTMKYKNPGVQRVEQRPVQNRAVSLVEERVQRQQMPANRYNKKD